MAVEIGVCEYKTPTTLLRTSIHCFLWSGDGVFNGLNKSLQLDCILWGQELGFLVFLDQISATGMKSLQQRGVKVTEQRCGFHLFAAGMRVQQFEQTFLHRG